MGHHATNVLSVKNLNEESQTFAPFVGQRWRMKIMYEELIKQLRWMEDVCKKNISCPIPCINECLFKETADAIENLLERYFAYEN